jgi:hypothetical protein
MISVRAWSYALGCLALAVPVLLYLLHFSSLGWPDGFLSELDRAEQDLFYLFSGASILLGLSLFWLGRTARRGVAVATCLYLLLVGCSLAALFHFRSHLPGSGGG